MPRPCLQTLPVELIDSILTYLPIPCLLAYGQTNKRNRSSAIHALDRLELAVFPKPIHCMLAFIEASCRTEDAEDECLRDDTNSPLSSFRGTFWKNPYRSGTSPLCQIELTTPSTITKSSLKSSVRLRTSSPAASQRQQTQASLQQPLALSLRTQEINTQNQIASRVLSTSSLVNIQNLTLHLYNLSSPDLANIIATSFPNLQHLNLNFTHAYINDCTLPARYWRDTPGAGDGTPAWNVFSNISVNTNNTKPRLSTLKSLTLRRAGITSTQLRRWIEHNPLLSTLSLEKVRGVDIDFCDWLADYTTSLSSSSPSASEKSPSFATPTLKTICIEDCANLKMNTSQEFNWFSRISQSSALHTLSLEGCKGVDENIFTRLVSRRHPPTEDGDMDLNTDVNANSNADSDSDMDTNTDTDIDMEMDINTDRDLPTHSIRKLISPKGFIYRDGRASTCTSAGSDPKSSSAHWPPHHHHPRRAGSTSPGMMTSEGMTGYWKEGEMEVDPDP